MTPGIAPSCPEVAPTFTYDEVLKESLSYFNGEQLPAEVFADKYALRDRQDRFLEKSPTDMHWRLAWAMAGIDKKFNDGFSSNVYFEAFDKFAKIVPQGSPMAAVGNDQQFMSASNCVVVAPPNDSIWGIMETAGYLAYLFKARCGVGVDISPLRPNGALVANAAKTSTGAVSFVDLYSEVTRKIAQKGRRGALMVSMSVHHPDIVEFARLKRDRSVATGCNVSIMLTDDFMKAVESDGDYEQRFPVEGKPIYRRMVKAREVWAEIISAAHDCAEPGLLFIDTIRRNLPADCYPAFVTRGVNPCSELSLSSFDACRLVSINLTAFVRGAFKKSAIFDIDAFEKCVRLAMRVSDNIVEVEIGLIQRLIDRCDNESEKGVWKKLQESAIRGRRTGLGTHGLADTLAQLGIKYDSEKAIETVAWIYESLRNTAYDESVNLAITRGPFPDFDALTEHDCEFIQRLPQALRDRINKHGRRNISILTQAPTGTVSLLSKVGEFEAFGTSSGVEPVFRNFYTRRRKINPGDKSSKVDFVDEKGDSWQEYKVYHSNVKCYLDSHSSADYKGLPDYFITSDQVDWRFRVKLQATEQRFIDHSISSTINLPADVKPETVGEIYLEAWRAGCKGITVYRDGSRDGVLITENEKKIDPAVRPEKVVRMQAPVRPQRLPCDIHHTTFGGAKWLAFVGLLDGEPYEMFLGQAVKLSLPKKFTKGHIEKASGRGYALHVDLGDDEPLVVNDIVGVFDNPACSWASRLVSMSLRHGTPIDFMVDQLSKEGGVNDINKVIARVLKKYIADGAKVRGRIACPSCSGSTFAYQEGCKNCMTCGWSKCS